MKNIEEDKTHAGVSFNIQDWIPKDSPYLHCCHDSKVGVSPVTSNSDFSRRVQIHKLEEETAKRKQLVNAKMKGILGLKEQELNKIETMKRKIKIIESELQKDITVYNYKFQMDEKTQQYMSVDESEIKVKKVYSKEEQAKRDKEAEARRKTQENANNNDGVRALKDMMGGTLDQRTNVQKIQDYIDNMHEPWMDENPIIGDLNDENKVIFEEYTKKCEELEVALVDRRKLLETQMKQLKSDINESVKNFDAKLLMSIQAKLEFDEKIYLSELMTLVLYHDGVKKDFLIIP
eukprot:UN31261